MNGFTPSVKDTSTVNARSYLVRVPTSETAPISATVSVPKRLFAITCYPFRRKNLPKYRQTLPTPRPTSPRLHKRRGPRRHSQQRSSLVSFPPPTFTEKGQPRALDTRLYPELEEDQYLFDDEHGVYSKSTPASARSAHPEMPRSNCPRRMSSGGGLSILPRRESRDDSQSVKSKRSHLRYLSVEHSTSHSDLENDTKATEPAPEAHSNDDPAKQEADQVRHPSPLSSHPPPFWPLPIPPIYNPVLPFACTPSPSSPLAANPTAAPDYSPTLPDHSPLPSATPTIDSRRLTLRGGASRPCLDPSQPLPTNLWSLAGGRGPPPTVGNYAAWRKRERARIAEENARRGVVREGRGFWREFAWVLFGAKKRRHARYSSREGVKAGNDTEEEATAAGGLGIGAGNAGSGGGGGPIGPDAPAPNGTGGVVAGEDDGAVGTAHAA